MRENHVFAQENTTTELPFEECVGFKVPSSKQEPRACYIESVGKEKCMLMVVHDRV